MRESAGPGATTINAERAEPAEKTGFFCEFCGFCVERCAGVVALVSRTRFWGQRSGEALRQVQAWGFRQRQHGACPASPACRSIRHTGNKAVPEGVDDEREAV
jgi:hypothetical protein